MFACIGIDVRPKLGRNFDLVAEGFQSFTHHLLMPRTAIYCWPGADKSSCLPQFCNPRGVTARKLSHETLLFCRIRLAVYGCDETLYSPTSVLVNLQTVPKIRSGERRASRSGFDKNIPKSWRNADATRTPGYCVPHEVRDFQRVLLIMCRKCIHLLRGEPCPRVEQLFRSVGTASHAAGMIGGII